MIKRKELVFSFDTMNSTTLSGCSLNLRAMTQFEAVHRKLYMKPTPRWQHQGMLPARLKK